MFNKLFLTAVSIIFSAVIFAQDTDNDGLSDFAEINTYGTNPTDDDSDDDGIMDGNEIFSYGTNPLTCDTDSDGLPDGLEVGLSAPQGFNSDMMSGCYIADSNPATTTNPLDADTDNDGISDGSEDADHDGNVDAPETDPNNPDTDADGCYDGTDPSPLNFSPDDDGDGIGNECDACFGNNASGDVDADGYCANMDCDDTDGNVNPGVTEVACDGIDNDCNAATADDMDLDGDGYSVCGGDCDDTDDQVNPGMSEILCDGKDNDCNPSTEDAPDADNDGYSVCSGDCDDTNDQINPGMTEVMCDGIDNDCNAATEDAPDSDNDGYSVCAGDCDDTNDQINPGMTEYGCDGIDNDCNVSTSDVLTIDINTTNSGMLIVANNTGADSYQWIDCLNANQPISGANTSTFLATLTGEYAVIIGVDGCSDTSACILVSDVGNDEFNTVYLALYPNPVQSELYVVYGGQLSSVQIFDIAGREVDIDFDLTEKIVYTGKLETGEYIVLIKTVEGYTLNGKILIQR